MPPLLTATGHKGIGAIADQQLDPRGRDQKFPGLSRCSAERTAPVAS